MKKLRIAMVSVLAFSLVATGTAMAKSADEHEQHKSGLHNALDHVNNPKAKEAIKRAMEKQREKHEKDDDDGQNDAQIVAAIQSTLKIGFSGSDSMSSVTQALKLATSGKHGSKIYWNSSNTAIISNDGKTVVRPMGSDVKVVLTATIKRHMVMAKVTFELTVKAKLSDAQIVAADKAALVIGFRGSDNINFVTSPLTLAARGANGSQITWVSSAPAIVSNDGKTVNRPAMAQGDAVVTLIATLNNNGVMETKIFTIIVKQQLTAAEKVATDKALLQIGFSGTDNENFVTSPLTLAAWGANGSQITWVSSAPAIVSNDGKTVKRPAMSQGDAMVTLIATLNNNGVMETKIFTIIVKQQLSAAEKVAADKALLQIGFSGTDTWASVTGKLMLPTVGQNGSSVVWYSSDISVIANNGTVFRPAAGGGDKLVSLTAFIFNNGALDTKIFTVAVKQLP